MTTRRDFLAGAAASAGLALTGCAGLSAPRAEGAAIALQLYSIHKIFWKKPEECLAALKAAGYDGVEFAGYGGRSAAEIRRLLAHAGLRGAGTHVNGDVDLVGDALKRTLDFCAEAGLESVTTPHASRKTEAEYRAFGCAMGRAAEAAAPYGVKVGIHATCHHFTTRYASGTAWDAIFAEASPLLCQQVDVGNVFHSGTDVVALLKKYAGRHHSVHLKENDPTRDGVFGSPVENGANVPFRDVVAHLRTEPACRWWVVEAERIPDSLEPARKCRAAIDGWLKG